MATFGRRYPQFVAPGITNPGPAGGFGTSAMSLTDSVYAPGESINPVRKNAPSSMIGHASTGTLHVPVLGLAGLAGILVVGEWVRRKAHR